MVSKFLSRRFIAIMLSVMLAASTILPAAALAEEVNPGSGEAIVEPIVEETTVPTVTPSSGTSEASVGAVEEEETTVEVAQAAAPTAPLKEGDVGYYAYQQVTALTNNYGSRAAGGAGEVAAGEYVKAEFEKLGLATTVQPFSYVRSGSTRNSNNIIAVKAGASTKVVIVGAHYDAVTAGKGTDDNASGIGVMMEAAKAVSALTTPYTIKFVAFGSEEVGLQGSKYYVSQMTAEDKKNTVAMINLDSLAAGDFMYIYGSLGSAGFVRDLGLEISQEHGLNVGTNLGANPEYPAGTTGDWSDHAPFKAAGIPYGYLEATNWDIGDKDGYTQTVDQGGIWHSSKDTIDFISTNFPGRIEERLFTFTTLLTQILLQIEEPEAQTLVLDNNKASMTEKRTINVEFELPSTAKLADLQWTYGGKPLTEWKKWGTSNYNGTPFIYLEGTPVLEGNIVKAQITFDLVYGTVNLSGTHRSRYPALMGTHDLAVADANGRPIALAPVKLNVYDSYRTYDEIKPEIDRITKLAEENNRYVENRIIGQSVQGRDIYFTILAKDKASVDKYVNETLPMMMNDPAGLQAKIKNGTFTDYKVPVWLNNIHPDEAPGIDVILNFFETMVTKESVDYKVSKNAAVPAVTLNMDAALDNAIFLLNFTENPDGRVMNTRANANGFDLNRDNSYQTQPETQAVTAEIAKWSPLSFLDMHGFVGSFLIEPCTPPHDPNFEFDLLIDSMVAQATAMGEAGIANTKYELYHIPYVEHQKEAADPTYVSKGYTSGWDDASPAYTAVYAMHHGALGHSLEIPELNEDSTQALFFASLAATKYVMDNKEKLFLNQLEVYKRGVQGIDSYSVDKHLVNAKNEIVGRPRGEELNFFPEYYVLPMSKELQKNPLEAAKMVKYLLSNGVKVEQSKSAVAVKGITYPAGSYVVNMRQAKRGYANLVLYDGINVSDFSDMYADIIQSFPYTRGFDSIPVRVANVFKGKTEAVATIVIPSTTTASVNADYYVIKNTNNDAIKAVNELAKAKKAVTMLSSGGDGYEMGDFLVSKANLATIASKYYLDVVPFAADGDKAGKLLKSELLAASGVPSFVLKELGFEVTTVAADANILVNTFNANLINAGKPYIGFGRAAMNSFKNANIVTGFNFATTGNSHEGLYKAVLSQNSVITAPYESEEWVYTVSGSWMTSVPAGANVIAKISNSSDFFKAGWWPNHDRAKGQIMAFEYKQGDLDITLFSNDLVNRAHTQFQYRLLANAIYAASEAADPTQVDDGEVITPEPTPTTPTNPEPTPTTPTNPEPTPTTPTNPTPTPTTPTSPEPTPIPVEFKDLGPVAGWAGTAIESLASKGIIVPGDARTRSQHRYGRRNRIV
jgi:hypothetical protein